MSPLALTARLALVSTAVLLLLGTPLAWWLSGVRSRWRAALEAVVAQLEKLAANPSLAVRSTVGRPTYRFSFVVDDVHHHWSATFKYAEDELTLVITHVFRVAL